ncbi:unnamed protein product [Ostreobium quekettii]|uniref:Uncharacterized protein n=1 Tax=Ostreobium quekettii TaxID=121088 RepID=A0A8S1J158_9CHLO|nr:unnamed protein product [Ostreobium quekettii]|eukprot:evm.model.scf_1019.4 EVM.evm.TU.scf_1019.4   scf_1019:42837-46604(-)
MQIPRLAAPGPCAFSPLPRDAPGVCRPLPKTPLPGSGVAGNSGASRAGRLGRWRGVGLSPGTRYRGPTSQAAFLAPMLQAVTPKLAFNAMAVVVLPLYTLMAARPRSLMTRRLVQSPLIYVALAALYTILLLQCAQDGLFARVMDILRASSPLPDVSALAHLLQDTSVTSLTWVHLLLMDLFMAREVYLDGLRSSVTTAHSVILCFMFGPTGILSHMATKRLQGS